jgi:hypothetical protein
MRAWLNRLAIAILALSVMQAISFACCATTDYLNPGPQQCYPHDPCEPQPCCVSSFAAWAVAPPPVIRWERPRLVDPSMGVTPTYGLNIRTLVVVCTVPANHRNAVPWVPDNFLARIQVFLI